MDESQEVTLYPAWREGLKRFLKAAFSPGKLIERDWLYQAFGIAMPQPDTPCAEADRAKLSFLAAFEMMREHLLVEHQIALANVRGVGYRIVAPEEQSRWAEEEGIEDIKASLRKMGARLTNVNLVAIGAEARRDNADALARLSMLSGMVRQIGKRD